MALKFYWANILTGGAAGALDKIPAANWLDKYAAITVESGYVYIHECDDDLTGTESSPWLIKPDDESGNLRLNLLGAVFEDVKTKVAKLYDTDQSNLLSLVWNEGSAADYTLNLAVGGASRTLTLNENLTIGDGTNITITGVTAARTLTMNENFTIGDGNAGTLTYTGASKILYVEDTAVVSQDYSSDSATVTLAKLTLTRSTTELLDLNPGFQGTGIVVDITPSAALTTEDSEWDGIKIDGSGLSPTAIGAHLHGLHIDFSSVTTGSLPHFDALHVEVPPTYHAERGHAIHANHGMLIEYDATTCAAGQNYTAYDLVINAVGSSGGDVHGMDVAVAAGSATVAALGTHTGVDVIHQHVGVPAALDKVWEWEAGPTWTDVTTSCAGTNGDAAVWEAQDDVMYFGDDAEFDEIVCLFATPATKNMHFTFHYSTGETTWTEFYPQDDTQGAQTNGSIWWDLAAITAAWAVGTVYTTEGKYWIKVIRTRLAGDGPTEDTIKRTVGVSYLWDKVGAISASSLTLTGNIVLPANGVIGVTDGNPQIIFDNTNNWLEITGRVGIGASSPDGLLEVEDAALNAVMYFSAYSDTLSHKPSLRFRKSCNDTPGTVTETINGDVLGELRFYGVDTDPAFDRGAMIQVVQNGAAGVRVPTDMTFETFSATAANTDQLVLKNDGTVGIKVASASIAAQLHVDQSVDDAAIPVLILDQADEDINFIDFIGTQGDAWATSITTAESNTFTRMIQVEYSGTRAWIKLYATPE